MLDVTLVAFSFFSWSSSSSFFPSSLSFLIPSVGPQPRPPQSPMPRFPAGLYRNHPSPVFLPDLRMPNNLPDRMPERMPYICQIECQNIYYIEGQTHVYRSPDRLANRMLHRMPDRMPDRMPGRLPVPCSSQISLTTLTSAHLVFTLLNSSQLFSNLPPLLTSTSAQLISFLSQPISTPLTYSTLASSSQLFSPLPYSTLLSSALLCSALLCSTLLCSPLLLAT